MDLRYVWRGCASWQQHGFCARPQNVMREAREEELVFLGTRTVPSAGRKVILSTTCFADFTGTKNMPHVLSTSDNLSIIAVHREHVYTRTRINNFFSHFTYTCSVRH